MYKLVYVIQKLYKYVPRTYIAAALTMDHIPYSFAPLILFRVPYTLDFFRTIYRLQMALGV